MLYMNTNVLKTSKHSIKNLVSVTTSNNVKDIIQAAMVSTPGGFTDDSPISPITSTPVKKPRAQKSMCLFTNILEVKKVLPVELELLLQGN